MSIRVCSIAGAQIPASIEFRVPKTPTLAVGDSGAFLAYELNVCTRTAPVTVRRAMPMQNEIIRFPN